MSAYYGNFVVSELSLFDVENPELKREGKNGCFVNNKATPPKKNRW